MRRRRGRIIALAAVALLAAGWMVGRALFGGRRGAGQTAPGGPLYTCPMHPQIISDRPGECPICGMDLVPVEGSGEPSDTAAAGADQYICPMHPQIISDRPGECPICGMDLVPAGDGGGEGALASEVEDYAVINIPIRRQQLIGVRTAPVEERPLSKTLRTVGYVETDESRLSHVNTKIQGWVETLYVNETGQRVRRGQPLLAIYSPELVATQQEYLLALRYRQRMASSSFPEISQGGEDLVRAARRRLELWDIPDSAVRALEKKGEPLKALTLYAPADGYVTEKKVLEGSKIMAGEDLFTIADLSSVWVQADIYEYELAQVKEGMAAVLTVEAYAGERFHGEVDYVYPFVDPKTRTVKVRFVFANRDLRLKPGMYAHVEMRIDLGTRIVIPQPDTSIIRTGTRDIVIVKHGDDHFEPREVELGPETPGYASVWKGVAPGEQIVTSGTFLVDSESRLQAALQQYSTREEASLKADTIRGGGAAGGEAAGQASPDAHAGHTH